MNNEKKTIYEDQDFESYKIANVGVLKIKNNVYEILTDLMESSNFIQSMESIETDFNIDGLLIINENNCFGVSSYTEYLNKVFSHQNSNTEHQHLELSNTLTRTRELVILNNLIKKIAQSNKLVINALSGEIVTPFFGASLAADLRLASEDVTFLLSHAKLGVHPSGALPYFLPKYLGHAKASSILFCTEKIDVNEALELGLINEILPLENFEELCIQKVYHIISRGSSAIKCTKKLLAYNFESLNKYLSMEECDYLRK